MNAPVRPPDEDVAFLMEVQQIEERYKRNSHSGVMVATSTDQDKSGETLADGSWANSENCEQEKGNVCGDDLAVDNRENKEGKVEEGGAWRMEIMEELTKMLLQKMKAMIAITTTMAGMIIVETIA
ncbi:hypothetical protein Bca4012_076393 [Brassica carinata]